jgi:hypothetical protein
LRLASATLTIAVACLGTAAAGRADAQSKRGASDWVVQRVTADGWTFLGMFAGEGNEVAVFTKPNEMTSGHNNVRRLPVRFEFRTPMRDLGLSNTQIIEVDCSLRKLHVASAMLYANNNLRGAARVASGWDDWSDERAGSPEGGILSVACATTGAERSP